MKNVEFRIVKILNHVHVRYFNSLIDDSQLFNIATPSYNAAFLEIVSRVEILCVLFSEFTYGRRPLKSQMECKITSNKSVS